MTKVWRPVAIRVITATLANLLFIPETFRLEDKSAISRISRS